MQNYELIPEYFNMGIEHILIEGYDHMVFIMALCVLYSLKEWKKVVWIISAFTIGHTLTLFITSMKGQLFSGDTIEFLIPCTILLTIAFNFFYIINKEKRQSNLALSVIIAILFGFIHGMGFSNNFRVMSFEMSETIFQLIGINLGIEAAQLIITVTTLIVSTLIYKTNYRNIEKIWPIVLNSTALILTIKLFF